MRSTSSPCLAKKPLSLATVTASRQGAPAFQAKEIFFTSPDGTASPVAAARQIGNACGSNGSAARGSARLLPAATPKGAANPSVAARARKRRREVVVASGRSDFIERLHGEGQRVAGATPKQDDRRSGKSSRSGGSAPARTTRRGSDARAGSLAQDRDCR